MHVQSTLQDRPFHSTVTSPRCLSYMSKINRKLSKLGKTFLSTPLLLELGASLYHAAAEFCTGRLTCTSPSKPIWELLKTYTLCFQFPPNIVCCLGNMEDNVTYMQFFTSSESALNLIPVLLLQKWLEMPV